jgi:hypothetical protein
MNMVARVIPSQNAQSCITTRGAILLLGHDKYVNDTLNIRWVAAPDLRDQTVLSGQA